VHIVEEVMVNKLVYISSNTKADADISWRNEVNKMVKKVIWAPNWYQQLAHWFKQRRVWAALLSGLATVLVVLGQGKYVAVITVIAGALGLHSYIIPKKK